MSGAVRAGEVRVRIARRPDGVLVGTAQALIAEGGGASSSAGMVRLDASRIDAILDIIRSAGLEVELVPVASGDRPI